MSALSSTNHALMLAQKPVADHARTTQQSTVTTRTPHKQNQHVTLLIQQSDCITYRNTVQAVHPSELAKHSELMGITHQEGAGTLAVQACSNIARVYNCSEIRIETSHCPYHASPCVALGVHCKDIPQALQISGVAKEKPHCCPFNNAATPSGGP